MLSDMGAIYTLGVQPGTAIRNNLIHDVHSFTYGGWGIYPDEGSSDMVIENNIVYRTKSAGFHQHYGQENLVRNNIFALGEEFQLMRTRAEDHVSFTFEGNIVYFDSGALLGSNWTGDQFHMNRNVYWDTRGGPVSFSGRSLAEWRQRGQDADSLVADEQRGGGIITKEDLRRYTPVWRTPIQSTYRGYTLITMPPSSSGGITVSETLNILENFAPLPPTGSAAYAHLIAEALRRSFTDRNEKLGDPQFVKVPIDVLTDKAYARSLAAQIDRAHASKTPAFNVGHEGDNTTHYSVVDASGNAVATTTTLNGGYGSGVWIRGGGFFMNNEMDDFAAQPGTPNMFGLVQGEANAVQPGKRMLSAMSPTIVLDPQGQLLLVTGAAGGPTIITTTMEIILNVIEQHMTLADAMRAPRLHHQALPDQLDYEPNGLTVAVQDSLKAMGHTLGTRGLATANSIMRVRGGLDGVGEPRSGGAAVGY